MDLGRFYVSLGYGHLIHLLTIPQKVRSHSVEKFERLPHLSFETFLGNIPLECMGTYPV